MNDKSTEAVVRVLGRGTLTTPLSVDAERLAKVLRTYDVRAPRLREVAAEIRSYQARPSTPLGNAIFRVWGDQGAELADRVAAALDEPEARCARTRNGDARGGEPGGAGSAAGSRAWVDVK